MSVEVVEVPAMIVGSVEGVAEIVTNGWFPFPKLAV